MNVDRRQFLSQVALSGVSSSVSLRVLVSRPNSIRAIAFDGFAIFDPRPVNRMLKDLYPAKGPELVKLWSTRQFEYMWLRTLLGRYSDFLSVTSDALVYAARLLGVTLKSGDRAELLSAYLNLRCWPEVPAALRALKRAGTRMAFLSNMSAEILEAGIANSKLENTFAYVLSTDRVKAYKPDPRAYAMGLEALRLPSEEILFVASAGWDAAGASAFGYPTFWVNRNQQPMDELSAAPNATGHSLEDVLSYLKS